MAVESKLFGKPFERLLEEAKNRKYSRIAALDTFVGYQKRIFEDGLKANGSKIGKYKDTEYKELRDKKGRETSFVNLEFTGAMKKNYRPSKVGEIGYAFSTQYELDKADWNEERYGIIFDLSRDEREFFMRRLESLIYD